ncbi:nucleoside deaminase [Nocardia sp. NEAU-G5]|uniref:Nucleoside deaminase n=2 Tax=Nocardia albiluteola TaxID=2842303 RepID=A0ABS6B1N9_9NOCA|nr:nucleoside deaminase [Nocardia albiluteola]
MRHAIDLARTHTPPSDDPPVGALVYDCDGNLLGQGHHDRPGTGDPTAFAELTALREAAQKLGGWRLEGCTVVTTLEPGVMAAGALVLARVQRLVIGSWDPYQGAVCSQWDLVRDRRLNHRLEVVSEVLTTETDPLVADYLVHEQYQAEQRRIDMKLGL